jgi:hypothetical protein
MRKKRLMRIVGISIFTIGVIGFLNSGLSVTGAFLGSSAKGSVGFFISLALAILGLAIFSTANLQSRIAEIHSSIKEHPPLLRLTQQAVKNQDVEREMNHLIKELTWGNLQAGLGTPKHIEGTGVHYLRGRNGARLFYIQNGINEYTIVGKASKANEPQVIDKLKELYRRH